MLHGVLIQEGRAAQGARARILCPGQCLVWASDGVASFAQSIAGVKMPAPFLPVKRTVRYESSPCNPGDRRRVQ